MAIIVKEGLRDLVYKRLHEMIEDNRFIPGSRINVEQLTAEMGISRTPIWQAIGMLEKEGLLKSIPNKGVFIQVLSPEESLDLYSVREVLECMAAEIAVPNVDEETITHMEKNLIEQQQVIAAEDLVAYARLDSDFHGAVYKLSLNIFLIDILNDIKKKMRPMVMHMNIILEELYQDHVAVLDALRNRDSFKAKEAFRVHNERMKNLIWQMIKENQPKTAN
jgi:DNA-binding GntR family transcriptional regulator